MTVKKRVCFIVGFLLIIFSINAYAYITSEDETVILEIYENTYKRFSNVAGISSLDSLMSRNNQNKWSLGFSYSGLIQPVDLDYISWPLRKKENTYFGRAKISLHYLLDEHVSVWMELPWWINPVPFGVGVNVKIMDNLILNGGYRSYRFSPLLEFRDHNGPSGDTRVIFKSKSISVGFFHYLWQSQKIDRMNMFWGLSKEYNSFSGFYDRDWHPSDAFQLDRVLREKYGRSWEDNKSSFLRGIVGFNWGMVNYTLNYADHDLTHNLGLNFYFGEKSKKMIT